MKSRFCELLRHDEVLRSWKNNTTAFLEKGEPFRERSPQHSVITTGLAPFASQPMGPSSLKTALVEPLCPLGDVFVVHYLLGLLAHPRFAHPRLLLASLVFLYPKGAPCIPQRGAQAPYSPKCVE